MKKYKVEITETLQKVVEVKAKSEENAISEVSKMYLEEKLVLDSKDFVGSELSVINMDK